MVVLSVLIDDWVSVGAPVFRMMATYFYAGREGLSVIENWGTMGFYFLPKLKGFVEQINEKGESSK
ncbi:Holin family protein [compost metagenome]